MVSVEARRAAEAHLRLAEAFINTARVVDTSSGVEIRNVFSRAYYALFHVCCAWLFAQGVELEEVKRIADEHGRLHREVGRRTDRSFRRFLEDAYDKRRRADYEAEWVPPNSSEGRDYIRRLRGQFYWLLGAAQRSIASQ